jgi:methionine synthase I (cobalamin-dependent)/5,10-methylenetetrahydrofolate reductase
MKKTFLERIKKGVILCDGAMGTLLYARGVPYERCFDEQNLSNPQLVQQIHLDYIKAGAEIIETNTFGANKIRLKAHGLEDKVKEINFRGAKLAREARDISGEEVFVAGSMGPLGNPLATFGRIPPQETERLFEEQASALLEGGADLFIIETFFDLEEAILAVSAIKKICQLPLVAQMSFGEDGKTFMGNSPQKVALELEKLGVDVIGANCSVGPQKMLEVIYGFKEVTQIFLSAQPNAGMPRFVDGKYIYFTSKEYFAEYAKKFVEAGVKIIGGCCGTTPDHIQAMAQAIEEMRSQEVKETKIFFPVKEKIEEKEKLEKPKTASPFASKLGKKFMVSVELDPPRGINANKILKSAQKLFESGVDGVNIADSPMARVRMSCLSVAYLIKTQIGMETVLHFTCRDRNLMGLQADLLGAHALGIQNILAVTGDPPSLGDYPQATAVYDVDSIGLVKIIQRLNQGMDWAGNSIGGPTSFCVGVAVNPAAYDLDKEFDRFERKVESGAKFAFTQPQYELKILEKFLNRTHHLKIPVFLGILPLHSFRHAEFLHHEVPGIHIPLEQRERMRKAGDKAQEEGIQMAKELLLQAKDLVSGVYLMPSFGKYDLILDVLEGILQKKS